jgi:hypothetical protein
VCEKHNLWVNYLTGATLEQLSMSSWQLSLELTTQAGKKKNYIQVGETPDIAYDLLRNLLKEDFDNFDKDSRYNAIVFEERGTYCFNVYIDVTEPDLIKATSKLLFALHEVGGAGVDLHKIMSVSDVSKNIEISVDAFENAYMIASNVLEEFLEQESERNDGEDEENTLFTNLNSNDKFNLN